MTSSMLSCLILLVISWTESGSASKDPLPSVTRTILRLYFSFLQYFMIIWIAITIAEIATTDQLPQSVEGVSQLLPSPLSVLLSTILLRSSFRSGRRILNGLEDVRQGNGAKSTHLLISWSTEMCSKLSSCESSFSVSSGASTRCREQRRI